MQLTKDINDQDDCRSRTERQASRSSRDSLKSFLGRRMSWSSCCTFTVVMYGMNVARSVVQEKTSRVFEVMLSTTRPEEMLAGKLLACWCRGPHAGRHLAGRGVGHRRFFTRQRRWQQRRAGRLVGASPACSCVFFVVYFLLGFLFYSALAAGFGASGEQRAGDPAVSA